MENTAQKHHKSDELHPAWLGLYNISKWHERKFMNINQAGTIMRRKVNICMLKVYTHRDDCHGEEGENEGEI